MFEALTLKYGSRAVAIAIMVIIGIVLIAVCLLLVMCKPKDDAAQRQADQTTRSGEGYANAAGAAVSTIENRHDADATGDAAVAATQGNIDNASNSDDLRGAVLDGVCGKASHRHDPACAVR